MTLSKSKAKIADINLYLALATQFLITILLKWKMLLLSAFSSYDLTIFGEKNVFLKHLPHTMQRSFWAVPLPLIYR